MLVQLAKNDTIADGASGQFSYACDSISDVYFQVDMSSADIALIDITVQAGNDILMNRVPVELLSQLNGLLKGGVGLSGNQTEFVLGIDFGQYAVDDGEELLITVDNGCGQTLNIDVYADVNVLMPASPKAYVYRKDESFSVDLCHLLLAYKSGGGIDESNGTTTFKSGDENVLVRHAAGWTRTLSEGKLDAIGGKSIAVVEDFGDVPRDITVNCDDSAVYHLCLVVPETGLKEKKIVEHSKKIAKKMINLKPKEKVASASLSGSGRALSRPALRRISSGGERPGAMGRI